MAVFTETWTGSDGAAWPSGSWTTAAPAGGVNDIQSNTGHQVTGTTLTQGPSARFNQSSQVIDLDLSVTGTLLVSASTYFLITFRADSYVANRGLPSNGYSVYFDGNANLILYRLTAATPTGIASAGPLSIAGASIRFRISAQGSHLKVKAWTATDPEPDSWTLEVVDTTYTFGIVGLAIEDATNANTGVSWSSLSMTFTAQPVLVQELGTMSGTVSGTSTQTTFSGATKPQPGDLVAVYCVRDDAASEATIPTGDSFSDGTANVYFPIPAGSGHTDGTGANGIVGVMFLCRVTVVWAGGTNTMTWTHPSVAGKAARIQHWRYADVLRAAGSSTGGSTAGAPSATNVTPLANDLVLGMAAIEHSTASSVTADSDTTNGSWAAILSVAGGGATLAGVKVVNQYKIPTAAGSQTYNVTNSVTTNVNAVAIIAVLAPSDRPARPRCTFMPAVHQAAVW